MIFKLEAAHCFFEAHDIDHALALLARHFLKVALGEDEPDFFHPDSHIVVDVAAAEQDEGRR